MIEIVGKTNIDFMGKRTLAFACSGALVLLGLVAFVQIARGVANLSIDFSGGAAVQVKFDKSVEIDAVRLALETNGLHQAELQEFVGTNKILVRMKTATTMEEKVADRIVAAFTKAFPDNEVTLESSMVIGPTIGQQLRQDALIAILISMAGIILYISARFEMRFGLAAALAMTHDVLVVLGLFYLLDKEITLLVVTALLTLAGYSLTDKVVVFDRIRENLRARRRESATLIINNSINQVLSRTIVTSFTVVVVLIPLAVMGGEVLHDFSLALLWGIVIGTYSSIFVASPLLLLLPGKVSTLLARA
ncbi:MAG: Protein translocase subunit SecF [Nitrospira sp.]|nr:MAG: Protein translocase subunit SecF [Nitrospira sp.]